MKYKTVKKNKKTKRIRMKKQRVPILFVIIQDRQILCIWFHFSDVVVRHWVCNVVEHFVCLLKVTKGFNGKLRNAFNS